MTWMWDTRFMKETRIKNLSFKNNNQQFDITHFHTLKVLSLIQKNFFVMAQIELFK